MQNNVLLLTAWALIFQHIYENTALIKSHWIFQHPMSTINKVHYGQFQIWIHWFWFFFPLQQSARLVCPFWAIQASQAETQQRYDIVTSWWEQTLFWWRSGLHHYLNDFKTIPEKSTREIFDMNHVLGHHCPVSRFTGVHFVASGSGIQFLSYIHVKNTEIPGGSHC